MWLYIKQEEITVVVYDIAEIIPLRPSGCLKIEKNGIKWPFLTDFLSICTDPPYFKSVVCQVFRASCLDHLDRMACCVALYKFVKNLKKLSENFPDYLSWKVNGTATVKMHNSRMSKQSSELAFRVGV